MRLEAGDFLRGQLTEFDGGSVLALRRHGLQAQRQAFRRQAGRGATVEGRYTTLEKPAQKS